MQRVPLLRSQLMAEDRAYWRELITPEGIPLRIQVAMTGDRILGFFADLFLIGLATLALVLLLVFGVGLTGGHSTAFVLLAVFLLRNFYFMFFELRWRGRTPGKRWARTRVINANGGPLTAEAVFVRNVTRDLEVFFPLAALAEPDMLVPGAPWWARVIATAWLLVFLFMPLFNKSRMRVGDMIAGTLVVRDPEPRLLEDLGQSVAGQARYTFTSEQLATYGIYELQVLEGVIRKYDEGKPGSDEAVDVVCHKIQRKIQWQGPDVGNTERFLRDFYGALRTHHERKVLFGQRQEFKKGGPQG